MAEIVFDLQVKYFFFFCLYPTPIHSFTQQMLFEYLYGLGSMLRTRHIVVNLSPSWEITAGVVSKLKREGRSGNGYLGKVGGLGAFQVNQIFISKLSQWT